MPLAEIIFIVVFGLLDLVAGVYIVAMLLALVVLIPRAIFYSLPYELTRPRRLVPIDQVR